MTVPSIALTDIKWSPEGLSVQPKVDGNFDHQNLQIKYKWCSAGSSTSAGNQSSCSFSNQPHVLNIKWQKNIKLTAIATDNYGNTATCTAAIPNTPGMYLWFYIQLSMTHSVHCHINGLQCSTQGKYATSGVVV